MNLITTIAAFALALGLLIVVHELGHYVIARLCNVKVLRFSIGFGRAVAVRRFGRDQTEWVLAAFPLGGYVKMLDEREGEVAAHELARTFNRQSVYRRLAIVVAGPAANFLFAIAAYWILFVHGVPGMKPLIGAVMPATPAAVARFTPGETIVKIDDEPVATWQDARWLLLKRAVQKATVTVEVRNARGEINWRRLDLSRLSAQELDGDFLRALGLTRYQPAVAPVIGHIVAGGAAERGGLRAGDRIVAIGKQGVDRWEQVVEAVRGNPLSPLVLEIERGATPPQRVTVIPDAVVENGQKLGRIGAAPRIDRAAIAGLFTEVRYSPWEAVLKSLDKTWDTSVFSLKMLGKMIVGEVSLKNLSGPITIADYAGQSAQSGWIAYLFFLALISISLGVLNLLPIPLLDGGHLMYYILEVFKGSPVSDRAIEIGQHVGMALLFTLMAFALYNDINRLISG
ncbi:MAG: RIP metalloprotease RseP [Betaproteobacteria bacterium]|nr:RIP metalloprotease RseP [Betaproteobacteria bacterium]